MIAMRNCQKCHRRFDAVYPSNKTICPMCEQGEMFQGEFTDEDVFIPDVRESHEEQYRQSPQDKKKLEKMFSLDCTKSWDEEIDEDDFLYGEAVLQQTKEDENIFLPLLADVQTQGSAIMPAQNDRAPSEEKSRQYSSRRRKVKVEPVHMRQCKNPYMKEGENE